MFKTLLIAALACVFSANTHAQTVPPIDGIYWDPSEGGRGYAVETQDESMFVAIFDYDVDSSPTFYTIQAQWDPVNRRATNAALLQVQSGPWVGGAFSSVGPIVDKGPVILEFPTATTGRFVFNGQVSYLQRFLFGYAPQADSLMRGVWHSTFGSGSLAFGDFLSITGPCTIPSCSTIPEAFVGSKFGASDHLLVGGKLADGRVTMLVDSSTSYYELYVFELRVNQWVGFEATFLKTDTNFPTSGLTMVGDRILGPSIAKDARVAPREDAQVNDVVNGAAVRAAASVGGAVNERKSMRVDDLTAMFPAMKAVLTGAHQ